MSDRWIFILLFAPALVLAVRAVVSRDPAWQRIVAAIVVAVVVAIVGFAKTTTNAPPMSIVFGVFGAGVVYLLVWAVMSKDPAIHRFGSAAAAIVGAVPILILFKFYVE